MVTPDYVKHYTLGEEALQSAKDLAYIAGRTIVSNLFLSAEQISGCDTVFKRKKEEWSQSQDPKED
jgi:hypothetical protein